MKACQRPMAILAKDTDRMINEWRNTSLACMTRHSVVHGDRDEEAFDQCLSDFYQSIMEHTSTDDKLCEWISGYESLYHPKVKAEIAAGAAGKDK